MGEGEDGGNDAKSLLCDLGESYEAAEQVEAERLSRAERPEQLRAAAPRQCC